MADLRLGNLLRLTNKQKIISVKGLYFNKIGYELSNGLEWTEIEKTEPIDFSLDTSILEKCDFTYDPTKEWKHKQTGCIKIDNNKFMLQDDFDVQYRWEQLPTYLHLLQNQYYFSIGNELDVSKIK